MTGSGDGRSTLASIARVVFFLSLALGVVLAVVAGWGLLQAREQDPGDERVPLTGGQVVVAMDEGSQRTVYVDGTSLETAECTVTAPDGTVETLEGFDPVGAPRLGPRPLGDFTAGQSGDHTVACTGVEEASVSDQGTGGSDGLFGVSVVAGLFLFVGVVPVAVISLILWRTARRR